jgi:hypothetical protein
MLLRRFTQHVKDQNWFAVTLDFLIVVAGIFIGLQVSAWNDSLSDRVMEREYLERLLRDMDVSVERQIQEFEVERSGIESMDLLADALERQSFSEEAKMATIEALNYMGWVVQPYTNLITVRELQSSGNISLIRSFEVRDAIGALEFSFNEALHSAQETSAILGGVQPEIQKWAFLPPSDTGQWGYDTLPDYDYILTVPHAHKIVSNFSGWFKYHSSLLKTHHADTIKLRDLVKNTLAEMGS